ncbi:hypothetical protein FB554_1328 [Barrientosiimonas humi]|uniref:Uncharacterized protein n=1 Tax=Barrientosiimonas humi TaxID=999931 RepID=A0A542XBH6_9MICO|nr:hypothetical protein FB554_1328 [Barrientosiimonas humi]CAG7573181.1 hypothetical protein BH39T_PBIAJDOK_01807 [Barrientosiimonas humi]
MTSRAITEDVKHVMFGVTVLNNDNFERADVTFTSK